MADLGQALDAALHDRYHLGPKSKWREPRSSVDTPRGLAARMHRILERLKGDERQAAREVGVTLRTWRSWQSGKSKPKASSRGKVANAFTRVVSAPALAAVVARRGYPAEWHIYAVVVADPQGRRYKNKKRGGPANEEGWRMFRAQGLDGEPIVTAWLEGGDAAAELVAEIERAYGGEQFGFEGDNVEVELHD
jgi:hypothetical protein